jgi:type VI secretion system protein VasG
MVQVDLKKLFDKLSPVCSKTLEMGVALCVTRTNYNVELEHWLFCLADRGDSDFVRLLESFQIDVSRVKADLTKSLDRLRTGNAKSPGLSPEVIELATEAWTLATIDYGSGQVRSGHLIVALLTNDTLRRTAMSACRELDKISSEGLRKQLVELCIGTGEDTEAVALRTATGGRSTGAAAPGRPINTPTLDQFTIDLTARARDGKIDSVLGRDFEIRQLIDILTRRRQNNPILTGEAGVGKTAVVEGFALRIAAGDVPDVLKDVQLRTLDLGLLQAGAGVKGEFENRLKSVIDEVKASPQPIILFIDEAHTLIGAGGTAGQGDAANLLKPALARGELRTVAATTWAEYKKYFEKDAALARRFQVVKVEEPSDAVAIEMVRGLKNILESHHKVEILDEAVIDAVKLSSRYISGRQLPDKAISLIDTSCARINLSQSSTPPAIEDAQREAARLKLNREILERETATGANHADTISTLTQDLQKCEERLAVLSERWEKEKALVLKIRELKENLLVAAGVVKPKTTGDAVPPAATAEQVEQWKKELREQEQELKGVQGDDPLVHPAVDKQAIAETVSSWTGIPVGRMVADEIQTVLNLHELLEKQIVGQTHALQRIAQSIRTSRAGLNDPRTPIGVFLLAGTSGVGKTETAISLAQLLYGGEQNMTVINMSEFKEEHKVSLLMGSPPGYVGYGEGGVLTEAVRRKPYSVVLLDEMEKAHPGVQDIFYQVFDKGTMKDGEGRDIDFKNTVILMTTNAGTDLIKSLCADPDTAPGPDAFTEALFPELLKTFKPAFLGRLSVIPYYPLAEHVIRQIIVLKLGKVGKRLKDNYNAQFGYSDDLIQLISDRCKEVDTGARNIDHILTRSLLPELSAELLKRLALGESVSKVHVSATPQQQFAFEIQ